MLERMLRVLFGGRSTKRQQRCGSLDPDLREGADHDGVASPEVQPDEVVNHKARIWVGRAVPQQNRPAPKRHNPRGGHGESQRSVEGKVPTAAAQPRVAVRAGSPSNWRVGRVGAHRRRQLREHIWVRRRRRGLSRFLLFPVDFLATSPPPVPPAELFLILSSGRFQFIS